MNAKLILAFIFLVGTAHNIVAQNPFTRNVIPDSLIDLTITGLIETDVEFNTLEMFHYQDDNQTLYIYDQPNSAVIAVNIITSKVDTLGLGVGRGPQQFIYLNMCSFSEDHIYLSDSSLNKYVRYLKSDHSFDGEFITDNYSPYLAFTKNEIALANYTIGKGTKIHDKMFKYKNYMDIKVPEPKSTPFEISGYVVSLYDTFYYFTIYTGILFSYDESKNVELEAYKQHQEINYKPATSIDGVIRNNYNHKIQFLYANDNYIITQYRNSEFEDNYVDFSTIDGKYIASVDYANIVRKFRDINGSYVNGSLRFMNEYIFLTTTNVDKYTLIDLKNVFETLINK